MSSERTFFFNDSRNISEFVIPNGYTKIGSSAFWRCTSLTNITIPNSVTIICDYAFSGCSSLINITIPNSVYCKNTEC